MTSPFEFSLDPIPDPCVERRSGDLRTRLALTRPLPDEGNDDWFYGVAATNG